MDTQNSDQERTILVLHNCCVRVEHRTTQVSWCCIIMSNGDFSGFLLLFPPIHGFLLDRISVTLSHRRAGATNDGASDFARWIRCYWCERKCSSLTFFLYPFFSLPFSFFSFFSCTSHANLLSACKSTCSSNKIRAHIVAIKWSDSGSVTSHWWTPVV